jgi:hypothetical protein
MSEGEYTPGRSLLAEMTELREQMTNLRAAMLRLVELQQEANQRLEAVLKDRPIKDVIRCHDFDANASQVA